MNKIAKFTAIAIALTLFPAIANAGVFIKFDNLSNDSVSTSGWKGNDWFVADSFSFGVEREMKESGEKGGTEDINIGVGELQECTNSAVADEAIKSWSIRGDADDRPTEEVAFYYN